jgi:hypothetical protein
MCVCVFCNIWMCFAICGCCFVIFGCLFCNMWVCECMGFVMCGCFDSCVGVLVIYVVVFTVFFLFFRLCIFILICY